MSFLDGLGRGLQGLFDGNRLALAQALASGDYQGAATLRARIGELQQQREARDAQVIGAKNLGLSNDEIGAMNSADLSRVAQARAARRLFGPAGYGEGAEGGNPAAEPDSPLGIYAPPPGMPPPGVSLAAGRFPMAGTGLPGAALPGGGLTQMLASLPRARSRAEAGSLPKGAYFFGPDGSLRRIV